MLGRDFKELKVWQKAHQLVLKVYKATQHFPTDERYGLISQIRRAVTSIPTNIAEGCGRQGNREFAHFLNIAAGSSSEVDYQLLLARDLGYLPDPEYRDYQVSVAEIRRMLHAFIQNLTPDT